MYSKKTMKSALETLMFMWGEPLEVKDAAEVLEAEKAEVCTPVRVRRLSQAALEVLAIIAYRQPVTRSEIDSIRGIKSERVIDGLMDKDLVEITGRSEGVGRPLLYGTTREFLKKFGFASLKDLPEVPEYEEMRREREEQGGQLFLDFDMEEDSAESTDDASVIENNPGNEAREETESDNTIENTREWRNKILRCAQDDKEAQVKRSRSMTRVRSG